MSAFKITEHSYLLPALHWVMTVISETTTVFFFIALFKIIPQMVSCKGLHAALCALYPCIKYKYEHTVVSLYYDWYSG